MEDPVILPSSRVTIDRQTIRIHLLGNPLDPFNRSPLKVEDVIPNTELKNQIQAWIRERRAKGVVENDDGNDDAMDLDP
jgi:ubiquitin conjugation factor E4 B